MNYDSFINQVAQRAQVDSVRAEALSRAALETLTERLTGGEALDLAAQLPQGLQVSVLTTPGAEYAERFGAAEFVARVARRAGVDNPTARSGVRAVFATVRDAITSGEFDDVMAQLPRDYRDMVEAAMAPRRS